MKISLLPVFLLLHFYLTAQVNHWETAVFESDDWQYLLPDEAVPHHWIEPDFDATDWSTGTGGFGYGDGDDQTEIAPTLSCYLRHTFTIIDKNLIQQAFLQFDYDDAIVIYLNGLEVVRRNMAGTGIPPFDQTAVTDREAALYQGAAAETAFFAGQKLNQLFQDGENILAVQVHNHDINSSDLSARVWLHLGIRNFQQDYRPTPSGVFSIPSYSNSNLPLVVINTAEAIPDEPKITGQMEVIHHGSDERNYLGDIGNEYSGSIGVEIRGSSSAQLFPKKSYGLETRDAAGENNNVALFGMPEENDWVLHGPYSDKSLMRNVLTMEMGRRTGQWAPRTQFCELILNGEYRGLYVFMEKIKRDNGRVDIARLRAEDIQGDELTGGYILKLDKDTGGDEIAWSSPFPPIPGSFQTTDYLLHYPELPEIQPAQLEYIEQYITDFETILYSENLNDPLNGYKSRIDVPSFIDYILTTELCKNVDGYRLSTYLYKKKDSDGGKLYAGPLWDYNLAWGNANYCEGNMASGWELDFNTYCPGDFWVNPPFWERMIAADTAFANAMNCRWKELRAGPWHTDSIMHFINQQVNTVSEAQARNFSRWPVLGEHIWPNAFVGNTYSQEINYLKNWINDRLLFMDEFMFGRCGGKTLFEDEIEVTAYPNPATDLLYFNLFGVGANQTLNLFNSLGQLVHQEAITLPLLSHDVSQLPAGIYYYSIGDKDGLKAQGKVVVAH